jgi:hypothetical protein
LYERQKYYLEGENIDAAEWRSRKKGGNKHEWISSINYEPVNCNIESKILIAIFLRFCE